MCIIMVHPGGKQVKDEYLNNSAQNHQHGCGLAYIDNGKVKIYTTLNTNRFKKKYHTLLKRFPDSPMIVHYRRATAGSATIDNCHPFRISEDLVFAHNMTIHPCKPEPPNIANLSDTRVFNERILKKLPDGWLDNPAIDAMMENYIGNSRLAFLRKDGKVHIVGAQKGVWEDGIWYSNGSYKKIENPPQRQVADNESIYSDYYNSAIKADPEAPANLFGEEWRCDGLILRFLRRNEAWDYTQKIWRPYDVQAGRFVEEPHTCRRHQPAGWKDYFTVWNMKQTAARKDKEAEERTKKQKQSEPFDSTSVRCDMCRTLNKWKDINQVIQRGHGNRFLCNDCTVFLDESNQIVKYLN